MMKNATDEEEEGTEEDEGGQTAQASTKPSTQTQKTQNTQKTQMTQNTQKTQMTQNTQKTQMTQNTQKTQMTQNTQKTQNTQNTQKTSGEQTNADVSKQPSRNSKPEVSGQASKAETQKNETQSIKSEMQNNEEQSTNSEMENNEFSEGDSEMENDNDEFQPNESESEMEMEFPPSESDIQNIDLMPSFSTRENAIFMANQAQREPRVYEPGNDLRLDFVYGYISRSFRIKPDKWKAFLQNEEYKETLYDFLDNQDTPFLVINLSSEGILMPITVFPPCVKNKSVYMIKKGPVAFPLDEYEFFRDALIVGDLPPQPLEALMTFVEEIIRPVVTAEVNQDKWPETVVSDLKQQTQEICSILYTVQGQLRGKTLLPMPINLDMIEENERRMEQGGPGEVDLQLRTSLETLVIKWSAQINEVLQQDPSKPLKTGQNPSPYVELAFWEERVQDLKTIYSQLNDDKVRKLANILEKTNSTYWPCFKSMFRNVVAALAEAQDILAHLKPLRRYLDIVQSTEFEELIQHLEPLMHIVCLVWGHSRYYCSPARIIDLLQEICNLLITRARDYMTETPIFQIEPSVGQERTEITVNTLQLFRELYDENKGELPIYFSQESEAKNWDFLPHLVFARYDKFLDKMKKIKAFFDTSTEFYNLEVIDIGGNKGKYLKSYVQDLHREFTEFYDTYANISYDYADPEDTRFDNDYEQFREKVEHVDKRLSAIVVIGFEASDTPESLYKLISTLGALLDRPIVKADFEQQYPLYVSMLDLELARIKEMYDKVVVPYPITERSHIFPQYPPYSASVYWAKGMKERIEQDMDQFQSLELVIEDKESVELLNDKYTELQEILDSMQQEAYNEWKSTVESEADGWLKEHLFGTKEDGLLVVNFNHELYATLKEVQYMQLVGYDDIPGTASKIFKDKEIFRKNLSFLDQIAHSYNKILRSANNSEREILKGKLKGIDDVLKEGKEKLTWSHSGSAISNYVEKLATPVADMLERFQESQDNVAAIKKLVLTWISRPLYERKEGEGAQLLARDDQAKSKRQQQYKEIQDSSSKVHDLVGKNKDLLQDNNTTENAWRSYINYLDGIVKDALIRTAAVSIGYLADHTDPTLTPGPLFEVIMELDDAGPNFIPGIEITQNSSFMNVIDDILGDVFHQGALVKRISSGKDNYKADMETAQNISEMHNDIIERVHSALNQAKDYTQRFNNFAHLWEDDKREYLGQFLKYGRQLTQEEIDAKFTGIEIPEKEPTIEQFQETIDRFEKLYQEVEKLDAEIMFDKWFRLNMRSFRQSLLNNCKRWSFLFKQYLIDTVVGGLQELDDFIQGAQAVLSTALKEGDTKSLIYVMKYLQQMKERQVATDNMFEPIKKDIELLKQYDYEPPDSVFVQLEQLPQKWNKMKKLAIQIKHQAAPLQSQEVTNIRKRIADFDKTQVDFREKFKQSEFFNKESAAPYVSIDATHVEIAKLEDEYLELCSQAELFEVIVPEPKSLRMCPRELRYAKNIWDCIFIVESCLEDWKTSPWQSISIDSMGAECARLRKEAKAVDIDLKQWEIFTTLESMSKGISSQ